ncbi:MAG: class I SAM-dependent methyltransferase [Candidatus Hadarchaeum sp.]|uniref:class I SAM-dependent methyltransferase n=1 Tax=Candidatus Hadarchaeum sp. TaxID=2883567 RepID=UPI003D12B02D
MMTAGDVEKFVRFYSSDFGKKILAKEAEYLKGELKGRKKILDIGCGIGCFEEILSELNIVGLDNSKEALEEARRKSDKRFVLGNAEHLNFLNGTFDGAFTVTTLEFLDNYKKAVDEVARVLEPGGKFVAMMLNPESEYFKSHIGKPDSYFRKIKCTNPKEIEQHISRSFTAAGEYFLGIRGQEIFDTRDKHLAALYVVKGTRA